MNSKSDNTKKKTYCKKTILMERLVLLRTSRDLKQSDIKDALHLSREAYSTYERGTRLPNLDTLTLIANYYKVSTDYLLGLTDKPRCAHLSETEYKLLKNFQNSDQRGKETIFNVAAEQCRHSKNKISK